MVISSDHGDDLGSHYAEIGKFRGKAVTYSAALDVPFILRWPGRVAPASRPEPFGSIDIGPTLLGLCGLNVPEGIMGRDFSPVLAGQGPPVDPPWAPVPSIESALVGMYYGSWLGIRNTEYTLSCEGQAYAPAKLLHNVSDPFQHVNLVDDPQYALIGASMHSEAMAWFDYVRG